MEQKPHKKEELMVANSVLKLAEDLLKVTLITLITQLISIFIDPTLHNLTYSILTMRGMQSDILAG